MTRDELVRNHQDKWKRLEILLRRAEQPSGTRRLDPGGIGELSELYRGLAADLMRARRDRLGADLERHLDALASRAHNALYSGTGTGERFLLRSLLLDFPGAVRRNLRFFLIACGLFFLPLFIAGFAAYNDEAYALAVLSAPQLDALEAMYSEAHHGRGAGSSTGMTGFYVFNNVGIAFRCFATGILFGFGPIFFMLYNGLVIGVALGHVARSGYGENILSFVSTHGPWELTAIVISGAAGLQMGYAMVSTHGRTRLGNLQAHGLELLRHVAGAASFLFVAALIEAWYSPSGLSPDIKYVSGLAGWIAVAAIIAWVGRRRPTPNDVRVLR